MRRPVIPLLTALILGITAGNFVDMQAAPFLAAFLAVIAVLIISLVAGKQGFAVCFLILSLFLLGVLNINLCLNPQSGGDDITLYAGKDKLTVEGLVCSPPRNLPDKTSLVVNSLSIIRDDHSIPVRGKILLSVKDTGRLFKYGNYIRMKVKLKRPRNFNNPGGFDYAKYLLYRGIRLRGYVSKASDIVIMRESAGNYFRTRMERYRSSLRKSMLDNAPSPEGSILQALILGEKEGIPEDIIEGFNRAGVSHILAISGLHVGIIAFITLFAIRTVIKSSEYLLLKCNIFQVSALFAIIPIAGYAFIAGLRISTVRATIMIICFLIALFTGRGRDLLNVLAFAAFAILIVSPAALFDVSFQLSFMAVASIILITPTLSAMIPKAEEEGILRKGIVGIILFMMASLSAIIGTCPLVAFYFNRVSTVALISNLFVIPIMGFIVLPLGILFIITASFVPVATALIQAASFFIRLSVSIVDFLASLSFASFNVVTPTIPEIVLYYLLIITLLKLLEGRRSEAGRTEHASSAGAVDYCLPVAFMRLGGLYRANRNRILVLCLSSILLFFIVDIFHAGIATNRQRYLSVTFIDVGQGNSTLVTFPGGTTMLVDGGGFYDRSFDLGRYVVAPYLWHEKITEVDIMVLTHPDQDHIGGLPYIAENFAVGEVWSNGCESGNESCRILKKIIREKAIRHRIVDKNTPRRTIGGVSVEILNPVKSASDGRLRFPDFDYNNNGVVMKMTFGKQSILLPADISRLAEAELVASGTDLRADILMAPHHGAGTSSTVAFLKAVRPAVVVISCGPDNVFGFPHSDVLERYRSAGAKILRTDSCGAVTVRTDGEEIEINRYKSGCGIQGT